LPFNILTVLLNLKLIFGYNKKLLPVGAAFFLSCFAISGYGQTKTEHFSFAAYNDLLLPRASELNYTNKPRKIRIAVVDDGFNLDHALIKPFVSGNPKEIPNNFLDDDENGFIDDIYGWNVGDNNNDVTVLEGLELDFYHGTMVASIISTVFLETYGDKAKDYLEIVPVKAVSNSETTTYVKDGYKGIAYALTRNVDIICCAWSGSELSQEQIIILEKARKSGVTVIGSAGNHFNQVLPPASHHSVIAVTAIDSNYILFSKSNCGTEIDFVARGDFVRAGHPSDPRAYFYGDGNSASVALVTGAYAVVKSQFPKASEKEIKDALSYTANCVDGVNVKNSGRLGSGIPQVKRALNFLQNPSESSGNFNSNISKGILFFKPKDTIRSFSVNPVGAFRGFDVQVDCNDRGKNKFMLELSNVDTTYIIDGRSEQACSKQLAPGNSFTIKTLNKKTKKPIRVSYRALVVDSNTLYCKDIKYLSKSSDTIDDGSGQYNYSNKSACKWLIRAPAGKRIRLQFIEMNTQPNMDFVWIFSGSKTLEENIMAKFSGNNIPPIITSSYNEVLLWFLTNDTITKPGWTLYYTWVD
tara:strand:- start:3791 stop:5539 length:1749 start_codon:yes stop_codon:yes gene_type:complete